MILQNDLISFLQTRLVEKKSISQHFSNVHKLPVQLPMCYGFLRTLLLLNERFFAEFELSVPMLNLGIHGVWEAN